MGKRLGETGARPEETDERLDRIISFCRLIDKEKSVERRTYISDGSRFENDAEHAWHMAVMALLLSEYADEKTDVLKVVSMLLVHDLVEIYAGDTFAYDTEGVKTQKQREKDAADRLYAQLPDDLSVKFRGLWDEFEAGQTPEAEGGRRLSEVLRRNAVTPDGSRALWEYAKEHFIAPQLENGHLQKDTDL